jgi:conjugative relaxase-like TrwC/TraI family protein
MVRYYRDEYAEALFYFRDDTKKPTLWQGKGAEILGIADKEVDRETFQRLAEGKHPDGTPLVADPTRKACEHQAGWDGMTTAPKSYSMAVVGGSDERLLADFERASDRMIAELEKCAQARAGAGRNHFHRTGNLTVSSYTHVVNRSEEAHLHRHNVINNFTFDEQSKDQAGRAAGGWRALEPSPMFAAQGWLTAVMRAEMAKAMRQRGYEITVDTNGCPQIAGISEAAQAGCSRRSEEVKRTVEKIRAKWEKKGRVWTEKLECEASEWAKQQTRRAKAQTLDLAKVKAECVRVCEANGDNLAEVVRQARRRELERTPEELKAEAERIAAGLLLSGVGLKGETLYTTKGVFETEENSILFVWQGRGKAKPIGSALQVSLLAELADESGKRTNKEQAEAFNQSFLLKANVCP